jgi:hypothetical protein
MQIIQICNPVQQQQSQINGTTSSSTAREFTRATPLPFQAYVSKEISPLTICKHLDAI